MFGKFASSRSIDHTGDQLKTTVYRTDTAVMNQSRSNNNLFLTKEKFITMND